MELLICNSLLIPVASLVCLRDGFRVEHYRKIPHLEEYVALVLLFLIKAIGIANTLLMQFCECAKYCKFRVMLAP